MCAGSGLNSTAGFSCLSNRATMLNEVPIKASGAIFVAPASVSLIPPIQHVDRGAKNKSCTSAVRRFHTKAC